MRTYYLLSMCKTLSLSELEMLRFYVKQQIGEYSYGKKIDKKLPRLLKDLKIVKEEEALRKMVL